MIGAGEHVRDALDGAHVERDVLTGSAVAAGCATRQTTVLVEQGDREAVDLELAQVVHRGRAELAPHPRGPGRDVVGGEGVVQAEHPLDVVDRGELGRERPADRLRGRVRDAELGVRGLECLEVTHQLVVLAVRDGRGVAHVVRELVVPDLLGQLRPALPARALVAHDAILPRSPDVTVAWPRTRVPSYSTSDWPGASPRRPSNSSCLLYTSDAADDLLCIDL